MDKKLLLQCSATVLVIIAIVLTILPPVTLIDDTFSQYLLGNGFPQAGTKVTYFEYSFLFYEKPFAWLFLHFPQINVMSVYYILLHGISGVIISYLFLKQSRGIFSIACLVIYLLLFFIPFLATLSYTSAAGHGMVAGFMMCLSIVYNRKKLSLPAFSLLLLWFLLLTGLRVHIFFPLAAIAGPALLLTGQRQNLKRMGLLFLCIGTGTLLAISFHQWDYEQNTPSWSKVKTATDAFFYLSNHNDPDVNTAAIKDAALREKYSLLKSAVYNYDFSLYNDTLIQGYQQLATTCSPPAETRFQNIANLLRDIKKPLFLLFLVTGCLMLRAPGRKRFTALLAGFTGVALLFCLAYWLKAPERIWQPVLLLSFLVSGYILLPYEPVFRRRYLQKAMVFTLALLAGFQCFAYSRMRTEHQSMTKQFVSNVRLLQEHRDLLFVEVVPESFSLNGFPALKHPRDYGMGNICLHFFFNTELRHNTLKRFGYRNINDAMLREKNVVMVGEIKQELVRYIFSEYHLKAEFNRFKGPLSTGLQLSVPRIIHGPDMEQKQGLQAQVMH